MAGTDASWAVQQAVYAALDAALSSTVYDGAAPTNSAYPYAVIGETTVIPADSKANDGQEHAVQVHVWDRPATSGGPIGYKRTKEIMGQIRGALHEAALTVTGHGVAFSRVEFEETMLDEDGVTRHGIVRARIRTSPE